MLNVTTETKTKEEKMENKKVKWVRTPYQKLRDAAVGGTGCRLEKQEMAMMKEDKVLLDLAQEDDEKEASFKGKPESH